MNYLFGHPAEMATRLAQHLELVAIAIAIACAVALPLGTLAARNDRVRGPLLATLGVAYTLPSLAVFGYLVPYFGLGIVTTEIALVAYAQLILVRNVTLGLGMTPWQAFWRVEFPQALPVMVGGVRLATVATISIATLAGKIGAGGLGYVLFAGLGNDDPNRIVAGSVAAAALAIGADLALRALERSAIARAR